MKSLRVCARCKYTFYGSPTCPKCGFGSYDLFFVYGYISGIIEFLLKSEYRKGR